jgi:hypothetical protein
MYQIISGESKQYVDSIVFIKLNEENGCYVICKEPEADGICVKVPKEVVGEDGVFTTCEDTVYAIKNGGLHGTEDLCSIEPAKVAMDYFNAKQASEIISMLEEVL